MLVVALASVTAGCAQENLPPPAVVAIADMAAHLNIQAEQVTVVGLEEVTWPDASLGCPEPGKMYAQVLVPGYRVTRPSGDASNTTPTGPVARCG
jgi:hypothetical protein